MTSEEVNQPLQSKTGRGNVLWFSWNKSNRDRSLGKREKWEKQRWKTLVFRWHFDSLSVFFSTNLKENPQSTKPPHAPFMRRTLIQGGTCLQPYEAGIDSLPAIQPSKKTKKKSCCQQWGNRMLTHLYLHSGFLDNNTTAAWRQPSVALVCVPSGWNAYTYTQKNTSEDHQKQKWLMNRLLKSDKWVELLSNHMSAIICRWGQIKWSSLTFFDFRFEPHLNKSTMSWKRVERVEMKMYQIKSETWQQQLF